MHYGVLISGTKVLEKERNIFPIIMVMTDSIEKLKTFNPTRIFLTMRNDFDETNNGHFEEQWSVLAVTSRSKLSYIANVALKFFLH